MISKSMTSFSISNPVAIGNINETTHTVSISVPHATDIANISPTVTHNGVRIRPESGASTDFTEPVTYTVYAGDGSSQNYIVTVTEDPPPASDRAITSFGFLSPNTVGTIDEENHAISVTVPWGTSLTTLTPIITHSGNSITPESGERTDFSHPVLFTVTAENGTIQEYTVTVNVAPNPANTITSFTLSSPPVTGYIDNSNHTVSLSVPTGTDVSALSPSITHTGTTITPLSGTQVDFTSPVIYTVTAMNGSIQEYEVFVDYAPEPPVITPATSSPYEVSIQIMLSCITPNTELYYTLDGTDPTNHSQHYTGPFTISNTQTNPVTKTVKAVAINSFRTSTIAEAEYSLNPNVPPVAKAGKNIRTTPGETVSLDGSSSSDPNGTTLTYQWILTSAPQGNTASISHDQEETASFTPILPGSYTVSLTVSDGLCSSQDSMAIFVTQDYTTLDFNVIAADFSSALNSVVMVSSSPSHTLRIYQESSGTILPVALPYEPVVVTVSPDGQTAAVGYSGGNAAHSTPNYVSLVSLSPTPSVIETILLDATLAASNNISSIVLTDTHIYTVPLSSQWESFRCINIDTGVQKITRASVNDDSIYSGGTAVLRPNTTSLYYTHDKFTTLSIERWDAAGDSLVYRTDNENRNGYSRNNKLWFFEDGSRYITDSGHIFNASSTEADDHQHTGHLGGNSFGVFIKSCSNSLEAGLIATINSSSTLDNRIYIYDSTSYKTIESFELPTFQDATVDHTGHGMFVSLNDTGNRLIAILKADATFSPTDSFALVVY